MLYMHFKCINAQLFQIKILFVVAYKLILDNDFVATKKEKKKNVHYYPPLYLTVLMVSLKLIVRIHWSIIMQDVSLQITKDSQ